MVGVGAHAGTYPKYLDTYHTTVAQAAQARCPHWNDVFLRASRHISHRGSARITARSRAISMGAREHTHSHTLFAPRCKGDAQ